MNKEQLMEMYNDNHNRIQELNQIMEQMEVVGEQGTTEYQAYSDIEENLCKAQWKLRKLMKSIKI
jgi:DNA-binding ferritin-like protein